MSIPCTDKRTVNTVLSRGYFSIQLTSCSKKSGFKVESQEDFEAIPDDVWDEFIRNNTSFASWKEMLQAAGAAWAKAKLDLNLEE